MATLVVSAELAERLRPRRPGYDRVAELFERYSALTPDDRARLSAADLAAHFIVPLFETLGWQVSPAPTAEQGQEPGPAPGDRPVFILRHRDLHLPLLVADPYGSLELMALRSSGSMLPAAWGIITNFIGIEIWNISAAPQAKPLLRLNLQSYLADESEEVEMLAAAVFYEQLATALLGGAPSAAEAAQQSAVASRPPQRASAEGAATPEGGNRPASEQHVAERLEIVARLSADQPSQIDLLHFSDYAAALADFITSERTERPLTIVIDAPWGMGKTTLMKLIEARLNAGSEQRRTGRTRYPTVWFDAWKYDQEHSLWAALALKILDDVRRSLGLWERIQLWLKLNRQRLDAPRFLQDVVLSSLKVFLIFLLGLLVLWLGSRSLQLPPGAAADMSPLALAGALISVAYGLGKQAYQHLTGPFNLKLSQYVAQPNYRERIGFLGEFEQDFERVVNAVTALRRPPLVVFVDDLDRCAPPRAAEVIEAINLLLNPQNCIFILAMDTRAVAASIEAKYSDLREYLADASDPGGLTLGQRFLEKIAQLTFRIPASDAQVVAELIDAQLGQAAVDAPQPSPEEVATAEQRIEDGLQRGLALVEAGRQAQMESSDLSARAIDEAQRQMRLRDFDSLESVREAVYAASAYLDYNPRKIKRFINSYRLQARIASRRGLLDNRTMTPELLAKWVVIGMRWPQALAAIEGNENLINLLREAYEIQEQLRGPAQGEAAHADQLEARLEQLMEQQRIGHLLAAEELRRLLNEIAATMPAASLRHYLRLTRATAVGG